MSNIAPDVLQNDPSPNDKGIVVRPISGQLPTALTPTGNLKVAVVEEYAMRIAEVGHFTYIGKAIPGSVETNNVWQIKRLNTSVNFAIQWANGNTLFNNAWNNYLSINYT